MEMANHWSGAASSARKVRTANLQDKADIMLLLQNGHYSHVHLDWQPPVDWIGEKSFVVVPDVLKKQSPFSEVIFGPQPKLAACLAAIADPPPAAWVRVAAVRRIDDAPTLFAAMMEQIITYLEETAVTELGWLVFNEWPLHLLTSLGFTQANEISTYVKYDMDVPESPVNPELTIRPARPGDMASLAHIEAAAFAPLWRHSASGLRQAYTQAFSFDVAEWNGRLVGFQFSTSNQDNAHLVRMTVVPDLQKAGIGSALLAHAIQGYKASKLRYITLNTQADNLPSQRLYTKFGFQLSGQRLPIWIRLISAGSHIS